MAKILKTALLCLFIVKYSILSVNASDITGEDFSNDIRKSLQKKGYNVTVNKYDNIPPAEKLVRLAIEMILESLRLSEMQKNNQQFDATHALNAGQDLFEGIISISSINEANVLPKTASNTNATANNPPIIVSSNNNSSQNQIDLNKLQNELFLLHNKVSPKIQYVTQEKKDSGRIGTSYYSYNESSGGYNTSEVLFQDLKYYPETKKALSIQLNKPYEEITADDLNLATLSEIADKMGIPNAESFLLEVNPVQESFNNEEVNFNNFLKEGLTKALLPGESNPQIRNKKLTVEEKKGALLGNKQAYEEELKKISSWNGYARSKLKEKYDYAVRKIKSM